jgi:hypothetical protein
MTLQWRGQKGCLLIAITTDTLYFQVCGPVGIAAGALHWSPTPVFFLVCHRVISLSLRRRLCCVVFRGNQHVNP